MNELVNILKAIHASNVHFEKNLLNYASQTRERLTYILGIVSNHRLQRALTGETHHNDAIRHNIGQIEVELLVDPTTPRAAHQLAKHLKI